jgi:hypothetical protein
MLKALAEKTQKPTGIPGLFHHWEKRPVLRWAPAAVAAILVLLIVGTLIAQSWPEARVPQVATLEQVNGPVEVLVAGSGAWQPASAGAPVKPGDSIATGPLAGVTLAFFDGSMTVLEAETKVAIVQMDTKRDDSCKMIVLRQEVGQTHSSVQPLLAPDARFEIETPSAVMAVRGTEFTLGVDSNGATHMEVIEGSVDVTAEGITISVPAGQAAEVRLGAHPALIVTKEPVLPGATKTPPAERPEPTETPKHEPTQTPRPPKPTPTPEPTQKPKPPEPTPTPEPTQKPKPPEPTPEPTQKPKPPEPTSEPPEPTQKPHPTHPPHPTEKPKPTKKPK